MNTAIVTVLEKSALSGPFDLAKEAFADAEAGFRHATVVQSPDDEDGRELLARVSRRLELLGSGGGERRRVVLHLGSQSSFALRASRKRLCQRAVQWLGEGESGCLRLVADGVLSEEARHELLELAGVLAAGTASTRKVRVALNFAHNEHSPAVPRRVQRSSVVRPGSAGAQPSLAVF